MILTNPIFRPIMCKIDQQNQLHQNKCETADHAYPHPSGTQISSRNKECSNGQTNDDNVFDAPEAILYGRTSIFRRFGANHEHGHHREEANHCKTNAIHGQIADGNEANSSCTLYRSQSKLN